MLAASIVALVLASLLAFLCVTARGFVAPHMGFVIKLSTLLELLKPVPREPAARRAKNDLDCAVAGARVAGVSSRDLAIDGPGGRIALRIYQKDGIEPSKVLLFIHGGGWVVGNVAASDPVASSLCRESGALVVSTDYRLAPEHPFPAAPDDVLAAYEWILGEVRGSRMPSGGIYVAGDSAGANLATVLCLDARERGLALPAGQMLFYPVTDVSRMDRFSYSFFTAGYMLNREDMEWFTACYVPDVARRSERRVSPLLAPDLSSMPPALVVTAEYDVLRDEGEAYAERLAAAGVRVERRRFRGMVHGFLAMSRFLPAARRAIRLAASFMRELDDAPAGARS